MKTEVEVVLTVISHVAEAAYSVQAFDWSGRKGRPKERDTVRLVNALPMAPTPTMMYITRPSNNVDVQIFDILPTCPSSSSFFLIPSPSGLHTKPVRFFITKDIHVKE